MTNIDDAAEVIGRYVHPDFAEDAARDLAAEGHLTPAPQIIRTVEELEALDPDTVVWPVRHYAPYTVSSMTPDPFNADWTPPLPAVVIREGAEVRAARKALEEA
ncbi:hypothetical protein [Corynebacterium sp.]|uniref:hypothetical protein n=1 Tax=Corynebacterium sp. TaxID=1720 RepID=UPI0025C613B3|nr:hypothetical protein [Corynebacterium sp.]